MRMEGVGDGNGIEMKKCKHLLIINLECFKQSGSEMPKSEEQGIGISFSPCPCVPPPLLFLLPQTVPSQLWYLTFNNFVFCVICFQAYHSECYLKSKGPKCEHCCFALIAFPEKGLSGSWGVYNGCKYHEECYIQYAGPRCSACFDVIRVDPENGFSGKWINDGNKQFHEECYKKKMFVEMRAKHSQLAHVPCYVQRNLFTVHKMFLDFLHSVRVRRVLKLSCNFTKENSHFGKLVVVFSTFAQFLC